MLMTCIAASAAQNKDMFRCEQRKEKKRHKASNDGARGSV